MGYPQGPTSGVVPHRESLSQNGVFRHSSRGPLFDLLTPQNPLYPGFWALGVRFSGSRPWFDRILPEFHRFWQILGISDFSEFSKSEKICPDSGQIFPEFSEFWKI